MNSWKIILIALVPVFPLLMGGNASTDIDVIGVDSQEDTKDTILADGDEATTGDEEETEDNDEEDIDEGTITGKAPRTAAEPYLESNSSEQQATPAIDAREAMEMQARPYEPIVYRGQRYLGLAPQFIDSSIRGLELIYRRDYKAAKAHFDQMSTRYADSAIGAVGRMLIWQALMVENFDFKYDKQFEVSFREARKKLEDSMRTPGNEAWEEFLLAGVLGVDAVHVMRKGNYFQALNRGFEAMQAVDRCRELAPDFPDLLLGDGIYNYWRSVVTLTFKFLPTFEDKRALGIQQMQRAERESIFLSTPATVSLAFSYLEERDFKRASSAAWRAHRAYPDNVINNILLGRIYLYMRRYEKALEIFQDILVSVPDNERSHYYLGLIYYRTRRLDEALVEFDNYLSFDLAPEYQASTLYRKGNIYFRRKDYETAEGLYRQAWKVSRHKGAKRRLERLKTMKKEGKIQEG